MCRRESVWLLQAALAIYASIRYGLMMNRPMEHTGVRSKLRRSQRVPAQLPVVVQGKLTDETPFVDPTRALVLSAHGCLITLCASVRLGERLILGNIANREEQDCRVVYLLNPA